MVTKAESWDEICASTIAKLYGDAALKAEFMTYARNMADGKASTSADFEQFLLGPKIGLPADLAKALSEKKDGELFAFVGKYICQYLW